MSAVNVRQPVSAAADGQGQLSSFRATVSAYVALCKPRIVELLLITAVPTLFLAYRGLPSLLVTVVVVLGGALAAGSANALNCYIDRDIDEIMRRTSSRPLVRHTVSPRSALIFGLVARRGLGGPVRRHHQPARGRPHPGRDPLLRRDLHHAAQAAHVPVDACGAGPAARRPW